MKHPKSLDELTETLKSFFGSGGEAFDALVDRVVEALRSGRKILIFGNGGSAAEAQHFAAELVNKFSKPRRALPAISLNTDTSTLTSIGNDMSFDRIFSRQIEALGAKGDVAIALSTSGNSPNVIEAVRAAKERGLVTAAFTGKGGGKLAGSVDFLIEIPSASTPRIQEGHLFLLHLLADAVDARVDD